MREPKVFKPTPIIERDWNKDSKAPLKEPLVLPEQEVENLLDMIKPEQE